MKTKQVKEEMPVEMTKITKRRKELEKIVETADDDIRPLIRRLVDDAVRWEIQLDKCRKEMAKIKITPQTKNQFGFYHKMARESQQQYTNVVKVLLKCVHYDAMASDDDFEKFLQEMKET